MNSFRMDRRGIFFTITAILLATLAIATIFAVSNVRTDGHSVATRIATLDNFLTDANKDFDRALNIGTFRALISLENYVVDNGTFLADTNEAFGAAIMNASYQGNNLGLMWNATLPDWRDRIQSEASKIGLTINVTLRSVAIEHATPWDVEVRANATILLSDVTGIASFAVNHTAITRMSIVGFEDPLYIINSFGRLTNVVNQSPYTDFVVSNDTTNLMDQVSKGYYYPHDDAPSFLMRLEGNLSSSPFGIESLVNLSRLALEEVPVQSKTVVDYLYFGNTSTADSGVSGMPAWFLLDGEHRTLYTS